MTTTDGTSPASLIDLPTLADKLGVNHRHIRRLVAERRIPFIKWGHLLRFDPIDVRQWIDEHRTTPVRRL
jgi:excisionase family DNA binding protein